MAWEGLKDWTFLEMYNRRTSGNCPSWQQEEFQLVIKEKKKKATEKIQQYSMLSTCLWTSEGKQCLHSVAYIIRSFPMKVRWKWRKILLQRIGCLYNFTGHVLNSKDSLSNVEMRLSYRCHILITALLQNRWCFLRLQKEHPLCILTPICVLLMNSSF